MGVFGTVGGAPQNVAETGASLWMQNAGFIWVPFILISTAAAWLGMNDIADAKASFAQQSVIFGRTHNWLMCVLHIGIFRQLHRLFGWLCQPDRLPRYQRPAIRLPWSVVGALSRAGTGWVSDRFGGGRVTFWCSWG